MILSTVTTISNSLLMGTTNYELTNHLGNVLAVVTDKKIGVSSLTDSSLTDHYVADILTLQDYYAFGALMPERKYQLNTYRYGFNGKENDNEVKGEGNQQDYGMRIYDPRMGRFLSVDPLTAKAANWTPYHFCFNNPILNFDPDGAWPWPIWARSFISASSVGGGNFRGDGRGPSLSTDRTVATSRTFVNFIFDPQKQKILNANVDADPTIFFEPSGLMGDRYPLFAKRPDPHATFTEVNTEKNSLGNDIGSFGFSYWAKDPLTPGFVTPNLDVQSNFSITENLKTSTLYVNATFTGDVFPSTEAFISDQSGAKLFLGARKETGGIGDLYGDNKKPLFTVDMKIKFDKKGNFTGVQQGDKLINVADWNKQVESQFEKK